MAGLSIGEKGGRVGVGSNGVVCASMHIGGDMNLMRRYPL